MLDENGDGEITVKSKSLTEEDAQKHTPEKQALLNKTLKRRPKNSAIV